MKNTLNQMVNTLALLILIGIIIALSFGSARITSAYIGVSESEPYNPLKIIILSVILLGYIFFRLYFVIRENPKRDFHKLKKKTMKYIEREHHDKAFEHYNKMRKELDRFFKK